MTLNNAAVPGKHLSDIQPLIDAVNNMNQFSRLTALTAAGSTQATALQLSKVLNQIDTVAANTGVILPPTSGAMNSNATQFCLVVNNGANALQVYGNGSDTINGIAGATGITQAAGTTVLYVSGKKGSWFALTSIGTATPAALRGTFVANGVTPVTVANTNVTANSAIVVTLKTVGGTVGAIPAIQTITPGTGFTIAGTASDTSVYNYLIIG